MAKDMTKQAMMGMMDSEGKNDPKKKASPKGKMPAGLAKSMKSVKRG